MVRRVLVPDIEDYLRCSLFYRFKHELELPNSGTNQNELLITSAQHAIRAWFNSLGQGFERKKARNKVGKSLAHYWSYHDGDVDQLPLAHARIMDTLIRIDRVFKQDSDLVIGGRIPITVAVDNTLFEDTIDGIFIKNGIDEKAKLKDKTMIMVQAISCTPLAPQIVKMRKAMTRYAINSAFKPNPYPLQLLTVSLPDCTMSWHDIDKSVYGEFLYLARSIVRHLDGNMYLPTIDRNQCKHCPYLKICSTRFCEPKIRTALVEKAKQKLLT